MQSEERSPEQQIQSCKVDIQQFIDKSPNATVRCVGSLKTIFKHQKYIIEVQLFNKTVIHCFKRYNDFEALYELIRMKYKNKQIEQFPSKFQLFGREETRKQYFEKFLNSLIKDHDFNRRLLSIVYLFLTKGIKNHQQGNSKLNDDHSQILQHFQNAKTEKSNSSQIRESSRSIHSYQNQQNQQVDDNNRRKYSTKTSVMPAGSISADYKRNTINQFQVKFENQDEWRARFIKVEGSQLIFYKHKLDNNFRTKIQLYRIHVEYLKRSMNLFEHFCEKMQLPINPVFTQNPQILSIFHEYDCQKILIRKVQGESVQLKKNQLDKLKQEIELASKLPPIHQNFDGVFHPIGKLFIVLKKLKLDWKDVNEDQIIVIRIVTSSFQYESKEMVYRQQLTIKQGFLLPISSTFEKVKIRCLIKKDLGWIREGKQQNIIGQYTIPMVDLITSPNASYLKEIEMRLEDGQQSYVNEERQITNLTMTVQNFSHFSSIYSDSFANQNDGKIVHTLKLDDISQLSITVDRVLRVFGYVALFIQAFWRNVYLFKYPRIGYIFWSFLFFNLLTTDASKTLFMLVVLLTTIILYNNTALKQYADQFLNRYIFILHTEFKTPEMLSKSQVSFLKWSNHIQYIKEEFKIENEQMGTYKMVKRSEKSRTLWQFTRHDRIFQVREQEQSIFEKMLEVKKVLELVFKIINTIVNTIQKVTSLFTWADYKKTLFLLSLLFLLSGIASTLLLRGIFMILSIHRLVKGKQFYRSKHYFNNRHFAVYSMRYIIVKSFSQLIPKTTDLKTTDFNLLSERLGQIIFPIHDYDMGQKLKDEMDQIVGVYLDVEGLAEQNKDKNMKNTFKIKKLLDMVQTCQSRLKLKWIPGKEGVSNEFQELKQLTKQVPVMDVWVESLLINFVLNTPSKLYRAFFPKKQI